MTQSLTERLQEKLATQSAEIEALTASELRQLGERLKRESEDVLTSMRNVLHRSMVEAMEPLTRDLARLRRFGRWWWLALGLTWVIAGGLSLWHWMSPATAGIGLYQTFTYEGRTFLMLPEGTEALTCRQGEQSGIPCVVLPMGERPPARPLARPGGS